MSKSSFRASGTPQGLTENMQILTGQKGDQLDKALTLREAAPLAWSTCAVITTGRWCRSCHQISQQTRNGQGCSLLLPQRMSL